VSLPELYRAAMSSSCGAVAYVARSGRDLIRLRSVRNAFPPSARDISQTYTLGDAVPDPEPSDNEGDRRSVALDVLCAQFAEASDGFFMAARYLGAEAGYVEALTSKSNRRERLLQALQDSNAPRTAEEALLRGKILYQLERYTEAAEQLKDVKSVPGTVWMALTQIKLNDLEHAFYNLASAIDYNPLPWDEGGESLTRAISEANGALRIMDEEHMQTLREAMVWLERWNARDEETASQLSAIGERLSSALCNMGRYTEARSVLLHVTDATDNSAEAQKALRKLKPCMAAPAPSAGVE
jgi:tetratricopeptide (TPR) repeat protein